MIAREPRPLLVANCSGFFGDNVEAMREVLAGGPVDVITGDYLAELTMYLLHRTRERSGGVVTPFLHQMRECLPEICARGVRVVVNAGGLDPRGAADKVRALARDLGLSVDVACVVGDDVLDLARQHPEVLRHAESGEPLSGELVTANAYLGGWGISQALAAGAQIVVTGRVTDASLVVGAAAWWHGWPKDAWDQLAGAVVAGHVLECGQQATGGNFSFFKEVADADRIGFPLAEIAEDGSSVITKHPGTGGLVSVETVTAQLLYEVQGAAYLGPDVTTLLDTVHLAQSGPHRVTVTGTKGQPPPAQLKVSVNLHGGYRNTVGLRVPGLDPDGKATMLRQQIAPLLTGLRESEVRLVETAVHDPNTDERATSLLYVTVKDADSQRAGRAFSSGVVALALATFPGCSFLAPPKDATPYGVYWPGLLDREHVSHTVELSDGTVEKVDDPMTGPVPAEPVVRGIASSHGEETLRVPLGFVFGARSGDKGGNANVGVWATSDAGFGWLRDNLGSEQLQVLLPETRRHIVTRTCLPNLRAVNLVVHGLLGEGVASSTRPDAQAKGLGEWLRARYVRLPADLVEQDRRSS